MCVRLEIYILFSLFFFFQAEDGIRDLVRSRGLGDVYKRQEPEGEEEGDRPEQDEQQRGLGEDTLQVDLELLDLGLDAGVARGGLELGLQRGRLVLEFLDPRGDAVGEEDTGGCRAVENGDPDDERALCNPGRLRRRRTAGRAER